MKSVYCDSGGYRKELRALVSLGLIRITTYAYENSTKKIQHRAPASNPTWDEGDSTWDSDSGAWSDYEPSEKWTQILALVGRSNLRDAKHLDSAFRAQCQAFLTSDQGDIVNKAPEIHALLGLRVFNSTKDWIAFRAYVETPPDASNRGTAALVIE